MSDHPIAIPLTQKEERYRERLKRMFPQREGGMQGLEERLWTRKRELDAVKPGANLPAGLLEEYTARVARMFPQREGGAQELERRLRARYQQEEEALRLRARQMGLWEIPAAPQAQQDDFWETHSRIELEFPSTANVIAVTPLEISEQGSCSFEYVGEPDAPRGVCVRYTREQLELAMWLAHELFGEE